MVGYFLTVEEVEAILPEVSFLVEEAMLVYEEIKQEYAKALRVSVSTQTGGSNTMTRSFTERSKRQIRMLNEELEDILEEIEMLGGELRDLERGIVDFPGRFQGKDIYYCWRFGQDRVNHWHYKDSSDKRKIIRLGA